MSGVKLFLSAAVIVLVSGFFALRPRTAQGSSRPSYVFTDQNGRSLPSLMSDLVASPSQRQYFERNSPYWGRLRERQATCGTQPKPVGKWSSFWSSLLVWKVEATGEICPTGGSVSFPCSFSGCSSSADPSECYGIGAGCSDGNSCLCPVTRGGC
jgi:hypothetical protein